MKILLRSTTDFDLVERARRELLADGISQREMRRIIGGAGGGGGLDPNETSSLAGVASGAHPGSGSGASNNIQLSDSF